jgi:hypothetical protein
MKSVNCDVIQDLLPSYLDKISSESTNKLVEEHLQSCEKCQEALQSMSKNLDGKIIENQDEQIDYLKGFRKDKIKSNIKAILIFIIIIIVVFTIAFHFFWHILKQGVYINVNDINVEYSYINQDNELEAFLYAQNHKYLRLDTQQFVVMNQNGMREIYIKICGRDFSFDIVGTYTYVKLDETVEKIYLEDKNGHVKEIWNKDTSTMTDEEWRHWYIDSYVPQEIKDKYNITYDNVFKLRGGKNEPFIWRQYYDDYYNKAS